MSITSLLWPWPQNMILEVCWDGLRTLSFGISQFHGHGSWLMCEVTLSIRHMHKSLGLHEYSQGRHTQNQYITWTQYYHWHGFEGPKRERYLLGIRTVGFGYINLPIFACILSTTPLIQVRKTCLIQSPILIEHLYLSAIWTYGLVWLESKNKNHKNMCLKEIGRHAQIMIIILDSTINVNGETHTTIYQAQEHSLW